jgi:hypothetical protein
MILEQSITPAPRLRDVARSLIAPESAARIGLVLSLALIVFYGPTVWYVRVPVAMLALAGWTWPGALRAPLLWTALAAVLGAGVFLRRFTIDNHQYLMVYWCAAIALSLGEPTGEALKRNARLLVGLAFGFAAAWKWASPEFVSGAFLEYEMLCDPRFAGFTQVLTGLPAQALEANRAAMEGLTAADAQHATAALTTVPAVAVIADVMTWSTLILESWIAIAFLAPRSGPLGRYRDVPLIAFLLTTYAVATVPGFAYLLLAMGFVQCERRRWWIPAGYLAATMILQLFMLPLRHVAGAIGL